MKISKLGDGGFRLEAESEKEEEELKKLKEGTLVRTGPRILGRKDVVLVNFTKVQPPLSL